MPDNNAMTVSQRDLAVMPIADAIEAYAPNFAAVLPANVPLDHFKRMVVTAINTNPELTTADRRTLFNACVKCASDGLLPDGREAALVVFRTKIKDRNGQERWIDAVQYMPMVAGIRKRMRNSGEVDSAVAEVVCRGDRFEYRLGDDPQIIHEPPPLDRDRGEPIGAYAIIKLKNGEVLRDVMRKSEIEKARQQSRAPNSLMWTKFEGEGYKKTVLRRCAKAAPQAATLEKLLLRDDETPDLPDAESLPAVPPPPRRTDFVAPSESESAPFWLLDCDGAEHGFANGVNAQEALAEEMRRAAKAGGADAVETIWEDNAALVAALREADQGLADGLHAAKTEILAELRERGTGLSPRSRAAAKPQERENAAPAPEAEATRSAAQAATAADDRRVPRHSEEQEVTSIVERERPDVNATPPASNSAGGSAPDDFWTRERLTVNLPTNKTGQAVAWDLAEEAFLRRIAEAASVARLDELAADNKRALGQMAAYAKPRAERVSAAFDGRLKELAG